MKFTRFPAPVIAIALAAALSPPAARAGGNDMACKLRGHALNDSPWLYNLPKAAELPPMKEVEAAGGFVVLDESVHNRGTCQYTFIGMAGSKNALAAMGSVAFSSQYFSDMKFNARARLPDGTIITPTDKDLACTVVRNDSLKYIVADVNLPKRFVLTLPGLAPGALVQYQATFPCDSHGLTYPNYASLWDGFQHEYLDGDADSLGWNYYPAANLRMIVLHDKEVEIEAKVLNDDGRVKVEQLVTPDGVQHYLRVSSRRPALPSEDFAPPLSDSSPRIMLRRKFKGEENDSSWAKQVKAWRKEWLRHTDPDPDLLAAFYKVSPAAATADARGFARAVNAFLRDKIKEIRSARGVNLSMKPKKLLAEPESASLEEHIDFFIALLRSRGIPCRVGIYRDRDQPDAPQDALPSIGWLHGYVIELKGPSGPVFFDPVQKIEGGRLTDAQYGAQVLMIDVGSDAWGWERLPAERADDNPVEYRVAIKKIEGNAASGDLVATLRGSAAGHMRGELQGATPATREALLRDLLEMKAARDPSFTEVTTENDDKLDEPLVIRAKFSQAEFITGLGARKVVFPMRLTPAPEASAFASRPRQFDVQFHSPRAFLSETVIPLELFAGRRPELPAAAELTLGTLRYRLESKIADGALVVSRRLELAGRFPKADIDKVQQFFLDVAARDGGAKLMLTAPAAPGAPAAK